MARVDLLNTPGQFHLFYNVDAAVGKNAPNRRDDVLLVQYLLKNGSTLDYPKVFDWKLLNYPLSGAWDRNWVGLLAAYTDAEVMARNKMVADGRVDAVVGGRLTGPIHHAQYTIVILNLRYAFERPKDHPRLADVADLPDELRPRLKWKVLSSP